MKHIFDTYEQKAIRWIILGALVLFSYAVSGQIVNIPKAGNWQFVDGTIPPGACEKCFGVTPITVDPITGVMTVTYSDMMERHGILKATNPILMVR